MFTEKQLKKISDLYDEGKSTYAIAETMGTYSNKIRRALKKLGKKMRSKSEAQSQAIAEGRHKHPTKGRKRTDEEKKKISEKVAENWEQMSDEEREKRCQRSKDQWDAMTKKEKDKFRDAAAKAVRVAAKEGSKLERYLRNTLPKHGYTVVFHKKKLVPNEKLEVDLYVPELKTVIEIDGPAHFFPIWGDENLQKHIAADAEKSGLLLSCGYVVLRVKHLSRSLSDKNKRDVRDAILKELEKIKNKFPTKTKRYIEIEVK